MLLADYRSYIESQESVSRAYTDHSGWARRSIMNTANMGQFSSDRAVLQYTNEMGYPAPLLEVILKIRLITFIKEQIATSTDVLDARNFLTGRYQLL